MHVEVIIIAAAFYAVGAIYRKMLRRGLLPRTAAKMRRHMIDGIRPEYTPCAACGGDVQGHVLHEPFGIAAAKEQSVREFDAALTRRDWSLLATFTDSMADVDGLCVRILECPVSKGAVVYRVKAHIDFDSYDQVALVYVLEPPESEIVSRLLDQSKGILL
jgi:hypothetical protein